MKQLSRVLVILIVLISFGCEFDSGEQSDDAQLEKGNTRGVLQNLTQGIKFYYGNLHAHSKYSDGKGKPKDGYKYARDVVGLDFYAVTDHSEQVNWWEWRKSKSQANDYNDNGRFVAIRGFEYSNPLFGHICVWNSSSYTSAWWHWYIGTFYKWIDRKNVVAQFNHPGREILNFMDLHYFRNVSDNMVAIETGNKGDGNVSGEFLDYYVEALDKGWKLAPTNNQDNHSLSINSHRTVILAYSLTRDSLMYALKRRRVYSSDDPNIKVVFKKGYSWMGSTVWQRKSNNSMKFTIYVQDDEAISKIRIISNNGYVVATKNVTNGATELLWEPTVTLNWQTYFFVEIESHDTNNDESRYNKQVTVTAPIWVRYY